MFCNLQNGQQQQNMNNCLLTQYHPQILFTSVPFKKLHLENHDWDWNKDFIEMHYCVWRIFGHWASDFDCIPQWGPMLLKWNFCRFWFLRWHFICLHISWKSAKGFGFILFCLRERAILLKLVFWESIIFYIIFVVFISKNWGVRIHF